MFRIYAGNSAGTGFVISIAPSAGDGFHRAIIATAWHVIAGVVDTKEDVKLVSSDQSQEFFTPRDDIRVQQLGNTVHDTALLMLKSRHAIIEIQRLAPLFPFHNQLARGAEVGMLGFPGLVEPELCFFHGHVSGYLSNPPTYLIDGVAINGVSGGPVFDNRAHLIGLVSAYIPNRINANTTLPGLAALVPINAVRYFMENNMKATVL